MAYHSARRGHLGSVVQPCEITDTATMHGLKLHTVAEPDVKPAQKIRSDRLLLEVLQAAVARGNTRLQLTRAFDSGAPAWKFKHLRLSAPG
jgi:hypothetical protein